MRLLAEIVGNLLSDPRIQDNASVAGHGLSGYRRGTRRGPGASRQR